MNSATEIDLVCCEAPSHLTLYTLTVLDHLSPSQISSLRECLQWLLGPKTMKECITPNVADKDVFRNVPIIRFQNGRSYKDHLVQTVLSKVDVESRYKSCE